MKYILLSLAFFTIILAHAQGLETNHEALAKISKDLNSKYNAARARVNEYAKKNGVPILRIMEDGSLLAMQDVINNHPIYYAVDNEGAAQTLGTDQLYAEGSLGVTLSGEGMTIGVWDGGFARESHRELTGRVTSGDGGAGLSNHATHVMGTILAKGIEGRAQGMAPDARGISYDFNNDATEMADRAGSAMGPLLVSNHSYGSITGWRSDGGVWTWFGDENISTVEDYRFGFYTTRAAQWDNIAYNAPFYTIVKSSGNDRTDSGDGSHPSDGPFDTVSSYGNAKNILTVGAVEKLTGDYTGPQDVKVANFSSWGPSDDGRIKPDIVGAGVAIYSTYSANDDAYGNLQGTSMSSPNVSGSILLLQQLHSRLNGGRFMRSATLKALAFQTAKEAGRVGPDYVFGWGLLDTESAAKHMIESNNHNKVIRELVMNEGEDYQISINPAMNTEVKATIVWTDLPGTPPAASLDPRDPMLVNDLDLRISDGTNSFLPWVLDPENPIRDAIKGDNVVDNAEQVVLTSENGEPLTLTISHKGSLTGGSQAFSLVLNYVEDNEIFNYYWVGQAGGDWNDGNNWSDSSGGDPVGMVPGTSDVVFFDDNSFAGSGNEVVSIQTDVAVSALLWLGSDRADFDMKGSTLTVSGDLILSNDLPSLSNGTIILAESNTAHQKFVQNGVKFTDIDIVVDSENTDWEFIGNIEFDKLDVISGNVIMAESTVILDELNFVTDAKFSVDIRGTSLTITKGVDFTGAGLEILDEGAIINIAAPSVQWKSTGLRYMSKFEITGELSVSGIENEFQEVNVNGGKLSLLDNIMTDDLTLSPGSILGIGNNRMLTIINSMTAVGDTGSRITIESEDGGQGTISIDGHKRICFDFLNVTNIDLNGSASVTAGVNSTLIGSANWLVSSCENVLFADFSSQFTCQNALTSFTDLSSGEIQSWAWDFGDGSTSTDPNPSKQYTSTGTFDVTLVINDGAISKEYTSQLVVSENTLEANSIVNNNGILASFKAAPTYQWYKNDVLIDGAINRTLNAVNQEGEYFVVTSNATCNIKSESFTLLVSAIDEREVLLDESLTIAPNPAENLVGITMSNDFFGEVKIKMYDLTGAVFLDYDVNKGTKDFSRFIDVGNNSNGIYIFQISFGDKFVVKRKVIIK